MEKILVIGGLGFIGTNLIRHLLLVGYTDITVLDNYTNQTGYLSENDGIKIITGDIRDVDVVNQAVSGKTMVINLAAHTRVIDSIKDPVENFQINVAGSINILESMRKNSVMTFISASTGGAIIGDIEPPVHEEMVAKPASPYGASKLAVEGYCSAYNQSYGMNTISLRFSNIYGPYCNRKESVVSAFLRAIKDKGQVTVYGDGNQTRDYIFTEDLIDGIVATIRLKNSGVYQLGSGEPHSINELIEIIRKCVSVNFDVHYEPARSGEVVHTYCDISKASRELEFNPSTKLEEGILKTWQWLVENQTGKSN